MNTNLLIMAYGRSYVARLHNTNPATYTLSNSDGVVGTVYRITPNELELRSASGYYRANGHNLEVLAKKHFEDTTGILSS